jgi:hypothetical protein
MKRTLFGVCLPVRFVPIGRGIAYVKTNRVLWAPSAPGRRLVDEGEPILSGIVEAQNEEPLASAAPHLAS